MSSTRVTLCAVATVVLSFASPGASGQSVFRMVADGGQEVPSNASPHSADGTLFLDPFTNVLTYDIEVSGLTGSFNAAHLHFGAPGVNGPVRLALSGGPTVLAGSATVSAAVAAELRAGDLYVNVHSGGFPGGELRGQVVASLDTLATVATGAKETPPNASTGTASGTFLVNADGSVTYEVNFAGMGSNVFAAHVHEGKPGVSGGIVSPLTLTTPAGTSGTFSGTTPPLDAGSLARLRAGHTYLNVHTSGFPGGEVRGQVVAAFAEYGAGCNGGATLSGAGVPAPGEAITISVSGGVPGAACLLFVGQRADDLPFAFDCTLAMTPSPIIPVALPPLDGAGALSLPATIPAGLAPVPAMFCVPLQVFGADASAPGGFFTTNGLSLCIDD